ncbi:MAG TPA: hypothetical protein VFI31_13215 [Pirellulales bacterium]|nr:hypothetical protein [Pirellulales bacterium]
MTRPPKHAPIDPPPSGDNLSAGEKDGDRGGAPASRWQFGLPALLGTMLLLCLPFAIWGAILRANPHEEMVLMLLCIATPLGVMVLAGLSVSLGRALGELRRRKDGE